MNEYTLTLTKNEVKLLIDALLEAENKTQDIKHEMKNLSSNFIRYCNDDLKNVVEKLNEREDEFWNLTNKIKEQANEQETN